MPQKWETRPHAYSEGKTWAQDEQHMDERLQTQPRRPQMMPSTLQAYHQIGITLSERVRLNKPLRVDSCFPLSSRKDTHMHLVCLKNKEKKRESFVMGN